MEQFDNYGELEELNQETREAVDLDRRIRDATPVTDRSDGIGEVELAKIKESDIKSVADFTDPQKYAGMRREAEMLREMGPVIENGADVETFHKWDEARQIGQYSPEGHVRGYADVYQSYHGPEAIAVNANTDGTYDITNGRHRIIAARDAGLQKVPARILGG